MYLSGSWVVGPQREKATINQNVYTLTLCVCAHAMCICVHVCLLVCICVWEYRGQRKMSSFVTCHIIPLTQVVPWTWDSALWV